MTTGITITGSHASLFLTPANLTFPGEVTVTATGTLEGPHYGLIGNYAHPWRINNYGLIYGYVAGSVGVGLYGGGTVANGSFGNFNYAQIGGLGTGVKIVGGSGTVFNFGLIADYYRTGQTKGVALYAGGFVNNIEAVPGSHPIIRGYGYGVQISGGTGTVQNAGRIYGTDLVGDAGRGIELAVGGTLINGSASYPDARILGGAVGVALNGAGTVTNFGVIYGYGGNLASTGVLLTAPGLIRNGANAGLFTPADRTAVISGATGIQISGAAATVNNYGTIATTAPGLGYAIQFADVNGNLLIDHAGAVFTGDVLGGTMLDTIELATGAGAGTLSGLGHQFSGFESVILDAGNTWSLAGANVLGSGASLSLGASGTLTVSGTLTGGAILNISGTGTLAIAAAGRIEVGAGTGAAGKLTVEIGNTLQGTGTIKGAVIDRGTIQATASGLTLAGNVSGAGTVAISPFGSLTLSGTETGARMKFLSGGHETLTLGHPAATKGIITSFGSKDTIDLLGIGLASAPTFANHVLTLTTAGGSVSLHFSNVLNLANLHLADDLHGGTKLTYS